MKCKVLLTLILFSTFTYAQTDSASSWNALFEQGKNKPKEKDPLRFGCTLFGGLGKGGNQIAGGLGAGGSLRAHYRFHTINLYASSAHIIYYSGGRADDHPTLSSSYAGLTYGVGIYSKEISASIGAGIGHSFVIMTTGLGTTYKEYHYQNYGACLGGQFTVHGKYVGGGVMANYNFTAGGTDYTLLVGIEIGLNYL